jgi:RND family efflux transporter MFP subunit
MNSPSFKRAEYEDQINIVKAAEGNLIKITSQYNKAKIIYDDAILKAPYSGVISKRLVTKGNYVNTGDSVFEIVNNEKFEIEANIPSDKIPLLNKKKEAEIIFPDGKTLKTSFRSIVPKENPNTRTVIVRFKPLFNQKKSNLLINQNMNLKIFLKSKKPIKTIVKDALLIKNGNTVVYVIENNIAKLKAVKTGVPYQDSIEIIEGLNEGEKVVTRGNERLRSNQKVQIEETK